jgi:SAM-dependent methyltransferase
MTDTAFTKEQFNKIYPEGIGNHYWNHARNRIISRFLKIHSLNSGRFIEIGCGRGVVLDFLRKSGLDCLGVELGDADPIAGTSDYVFTNTDAFELPEGLRQSIDGVLLFDVIEHLENPSEFLQEIKRKFSNAKHLVITVPARQELWTNYDVFNGHFKRYNLADLKDITAPDVLLPEACYFNHILYPVFWMFARLIKKRGTQIKAPSGIFVQLHRIMSVILQIDFDLFPSRLYGTSIIALFSLTPRVGA